MNGQPPSESSTVIPSVKAELPSRGVNEPGGSRQSGRPGPDPRERITPEAFAVAPELLGRPLAKPMARGWAWLIDGAFIALLSQAGPFFLALALAALCYQLISKRKSFADIKHGIGVPMWRLVRSGPIANAAPVSAAPVDDNVVSASSGVQTRAGKLPLILVAVFVAWAALTGLNWITAQFADETPDIALDSAEASLETAGEPGYEPAVVAGGEELTRLRAENRKLKTETARFSFLEAGRKLLDDIGFGFGWGAVYFSLVTAWWQGQTLGKRMLGLRVVQLSGKPLSVWDCFNRYGGYAAGFATGLLGFAQVFWDDNRQAIHDKISFTVVVDEKRA